MVMDFGSIQGETVITDNGKMIKFRESAPLFSKTSKKPILIVSTRVLSSTFASTDLGGKILKTGTSLKASTKRTDHKAEVYTGGRTALSSKANST
jgi:hypothetical protein